MKNTSRLSPFAAKHSANAGDRSLYHNTQGDGLDRASSCFFCIKIQGICRLSQPSDRSLGAPVDIDPTTALSRSLAEQTLRRSWRKQHELIGGHDRLAARC
jgi:hypothetical protein